MKNAYLLALLALLTGLTAASVYKAHGIETILLTPEELKLDTYTTTWESSVGTHTVTTTRQDGETQAEHAARHRDAVAALQEQYPKV